MTSLNQVMAQESRIWESLRQNPMESFQVIDGLSVKDTFIEEILIDIGNRLRVEVGSLGICKERRKIGGSGSRQRRADAGLNDRVAADDLVSVRADSRAVQRMS